MFMFKKGIYKIDERDTLYTQCFIKKFIQNQYYFKSNYTE